MKTLGAFLARGKLVVQPDRFDDLRVDALLLEDPHSLPAVDGKIRVCHLYVEVVEEAGQRPFFTVLAEVPGQGP